MEDRTVRIPYDKQTRAALRLVTKQTTAAGNIRFTAERTPDGHADEFWALALAIHAASSPMGPFSWQAVPTHTRGFDNVRSTKPEEEDISIPESEAW
jgi:phage FluMu gp28-like protein